MAPATDRQEYPAILAQVQPPQAVNVLNDRVLQITKLNTAVADWLKERRRLEEQYADGLKMLVQRQLVGIDLGIFSVPWTTLTSSLEILADSHSTLATKIEVDVERPLREFAATNREMNNLSTVQGNLGALAKDVERAQQKTDKLRGKGEAGKVASASSELESAQAHWDSQAPYVFESLQSLDETRLNHLRDALTQYQTHEMDQLERSRKSGEQCLNVLLNVEPADEIKAFAIKAVQNKPTLARTQRNSVAYATPSRTTSAGAANVLAPTTSRSEEDLTRDRTGSTDEKAKGRVKGLRRLGTVLGRKRESKMPAGLPSTAESSESRPRVSPMNSFGGRFGRSRENTPTLATMQETSPQLQQRPSFPPQLGSEIFDSPSEVRADPTTPPANSRDVGSLPQINGTPFSVSSFQPSSSAAPNGTHQSDLSDLEPPPPAVFTERKESLRALEGQTQTDSEGFSVPPSALDPISQAQQDAAFVDEGTSPALNVNIRDAPIQEGDAAEGDLASAANRLQAPPPSTKRTSTIRGRRTDRSSTIPSAVVPEEQSASAFAPPVASPSREISEPTPIQTAPPEVQPANVTDGGLSLSPATTLGTGLASAAAFSPFSPTSEIQSPLQAATSPDRDTRSIRSATTTSSQGGLKHPEFTESGLNSSVVETISARFENGQLMTSSLIGEVALAYNPSDFSSPFGTETIRLENFSTLEKVAPNPAFINPVPDRTGEYSVNLSSIARTQIAFKYQIRLDPEIGAQAPLLIKPALRIEATQCSVIVSYSLNPAFDLRGQTSLTLSNVMLALSLEGTRASGCQSKPVGSFIRDKSLIYWQLNELTLAPDAAPEKLLARFATDSEATGASVEAKWEIVGAGAQNVGSGLSVSAQHSGGAAGEGSDPFADESVQAAAWKAVSGVRKITSGSYVAK